MAIAGRTSYDPRTNKEGRVKTRTQLWAAAVAMLLMCASVAGVGQQQSGEASAVPFDDFGEMVSLGDGAAVATGLDNPRGLDLWRGKLFIAEAGTGGDGSCVPGIFAPEICLGRTGSVTMVTRPGQQRRILERLPSLAGPDGSFAYGPSDVSVDGGQVYVSIGGPNEPGHRELIAEAIGQKLGTIQLLVGRGSVTLGDISAFVARRDPDGPPHETNTHSVLAGRHGVYAIDAASNALFGIDWRGRLRVLHVFDDVALPDGTTIDAVPTNMVFGPDGALYVSTLTGVPFPERAAAVWRWDGIRATPFAKGLTAAIDLAFGPDRSLYVVEMRSVIGLSGRVLRIAPSGKRTVVADGLDFPTGIAMGHRAFYVANHGTSPGIGEVLRFRR
jgi:hypothetical protein